MSLYFARFIKWMSRRFVGGCANGEETWIRRLYFLSRLSRYSIGSSVSRAKRGRLSVTDEPTRLAARTSTLLLREKVENQEALDNQVGLDQLLITQL